MNKKSKIVFIIFIFFISFLSVELLYVNSTKKMTEDTLNKKIEFIKLIQLPDLAISTEATYIRHRSLSGVGSIYKDDGSLREYFPSTYAISHSNIINKDYK